MSPLDGGHFVALEGIDGAGKTSVAAEVLRRMPQDETLAVPRRSARDGSPVVQHLLEQLANILWNSGESADVPAEFWVHLQAAWFTAVSHRVVRPALTRGKILVADGWIYKFCAKLMIQEPLTIPIDAAFRSVARPDTVIVLDVPVDVAWRRKQSAGIRASEMGLYAAYRDLDAGSFASYQSAIRKQLLAMASSRGWIVLGLTGSESVAECAQIVVDIAHERSTRIQAGDGGGRRHSRS